uniref:Uncharacterized protein n=1 Tax=uncultured nuHF2 cluster bacterium HF0500_39O04 TaxID=723590 RepID=E7C697_9BACT|nr:hypothetical protein [uncultured nuHF2 cluster bacterium HF0500_39O04]
MSFQNFSPTGLLFCILIFLGGCESGMGVKPMPMNKGDSSKSAQASFSQFQDVPIPIGAEMDLDRTVILGARESWIGRLTLETSHNSVKLFNFFKQKTPEFGWQEITSIRSATSVLTYSQTNRVLTIQIIAKTLQGSEVVMTVSPRDQNTGS